MTGAHPSTGESARTADASFTAVAPSSESAFEDSGAAFAFGPAVSNGLFAIFAPKPAPQEARVVAELVPYGEFQAPKNPPLPTPRPDFGDRRAVAATSPAQSAPAQAQVAANEAQTADAADASSASARPDVQAANSRSLAAYEQYEAGVPSEEASPRMDGFVYTPVSFEVAGAPPAAESAVQPNLRGAAGNGALLEQSGARRWRAAYDNVETNCFPHSLRRALDTIGKHFGGEVLVTSGARDRGRRGSLHRSCKAADVRIAGVSPKAIAEFARTVPGVNGVGTYRWVAVTHVDVRDERFAWRW